MKNKTEIIDVATNNQIIWESYDVNAYQGVSIEDYIEIDKLIDNKVIIPKGKTFLVTNVESITEQQINIMKIYVDIVDRPDKR